MRKILIMLLITIIFTCCGCEFKEPSESQKELIDINNLDISAITDQNYTGTSITPEVTISINDKVLIENEDYLLNYENNIDVGTAKIIIKGIGNYTGIKEIEFDIVKPNSNNSKAKITCTNKEYNGTTQVIATCKGGTISNASKKDVGSYTVQCKGDSNHNDAKSILCSITALDISKVTFSSISDQEYTGKPIMPNVIVKSGSKELILNTDYSLNYANNISAGTAKITITGKGNYKGTKVLTFNIIEVKKYKITLDNNGATTVGTTGIYENYNVGFYLDSGLTKKMTTSANAIKVPTKTGYVFRGYFTSKGHQAITASGKINQNFKKTYFNEDGTLIARWASADKELKLLGHIAITDNNKVVTIQGESKSSNENVCWSRQGFGIANTADGDYYIIGIGCGQADSNNRFPKSKIAIYNRKSEVKSFIVGDYKLGHANDITYNMATGDVYIAGTSTSGIASRSFNLKGALAGNFELKNKLFYNSSGKSMLLSGIAYDESNGNIYGAGGENVYSFNASTGKIIKSFTKIQKDTPQGIGGYKGKILVVRWNGYAYANQYTDVTYTRNALDIYRQDGTYLGSYIIDSDKELESIAYNKTTKKLALFLGSNVHEVDVRIPD